MKNAHADAARHAARILADTFSALGVKVRMYDDLSCESHVTVVSLENILIDTECGPDATEFYFSHDTGSIITDC